MLLTKRFFKCITASVLALSVFGASLHADDALSVDANVGVYTDFIFRGVNLFDGTSYQPGVGLAYDLGEAGVLSATAKAYLQGEGANRTSAERFTRIDYTVDYTYDFGIVDATVGHIFFTFPDSDDNIDDTNEIFARIALDLPLNPTYTFYHDYDRDNSNYYTVDISHTIECPALGDGFNMTPYVVAGFANSANGVYAKDGHVHTTFGVTMDLSLGDISVVPGFHYTRGSDTVAADAFFAGTTLSYTF